MYDMLWAKEDRLAGKFNFVKRKKKKTRSSWVNCALRDEEAVYWVSVAHYEEAAVGN